MSTAQSDFILHMHLKGHEGKPMQSGVFEKQQRGPQTRNINRQLFTQGSYQALLQSFTRVYVCSWGT